MKIRQFGRKTICLLLTLCLIFSLSSAALAAGDETICATDGSGKNYTSYKDAWAAAKNGQTITMMCDWVLDGYLELGKDETAAINMNGYAIRRSNTAYVTGGEVILLNENAVLSLNGCDQNNQDVKKTFDITSYRLNGQYGKKTSEVGGLISGGKSASGGAGVVMQTASQLTLNNVAVAGNVVNLNQTGALTNQSGGGVRMEGDKCCLYLKNNACIDYNSTPATGGGICVCGVDCTISLCGGSHILGNYAICYGGGITSLASGTSVILDEDSTLDSNIAQIGGGALYLSQTGFNICSNDKTGKIINNKSLTNDGGAIYLPSLSSTVSSTIQGLWMYNNWSYLDGGAIYLNQEKVTIKDCKFTDNQAKSEGGAIYIDNDDCTIDGCTFMNNQAVTAGGGIYASSTNDFTLRGKIIAEGNLRTSDSANPKDDIYLNQAGVWFMTSTSYFIGAPSSDSWIGVRTDADDDEDRQIGKKASYPENAFFSDNPNLHIEASGSELWLKEGTRYALTVNGEHVGSFAAGKTVTINGTPDDKNAFFFWNAADDVTYADPTAMITTFVMPAHDVDLTASYMEKTDKFTLTVPAPVAGEELAEKGTITWENTSGSSHTTRDVIWLEEVDGKTQPVSGKAEYGKSYSVAVVLEQNYYASIAFDETVQADVVYTDQYSTGTAEAAYLAKVDDAGALRIYGKQISTTRARVTAVPSTDLIIRKDSDAEALKGYLPQTLLLTTDRGMASVSVSYAADALDGVKFDTVGTYTVIGNLDYTSEDVDPNGHETALITVSVRSDGVLNAPTANTASGTYTAADTAVTVNEDQSISMQIDFSQNDEHATGIKYTLISSYNTEDGLTGNAEPGTGNSVTLTAAKGQRTTFVLSIASTAEGYTDSSAVSYTYVLDNPYTVTVHGIDTGLKTGGDAGELYEAKTYRYHTGDSVVIGAAAVDGELFEKWEDLKGISGECTDMTLKVTSITEDIELTAIYNPVVQELTLTMDAPETGKALPTGIRSASVRSGAYSGTCEVTDLFDSITWTPEDTAAAGGVSYTAALKAATDGYTQSGMKIRISDNLTVQVKDSEGNTLSVTAAAQVENGNQLTVYLTFPETAAEEPEPTPQPEPEPTPQPKPQPTPDTPEKPTTPDKGSEKPDYSDCPHDSTCPIPHYKDADPKAWYHDGVHYCLDNGLMNGVSSTEFAPNATMTRAQLVTILWRMDGEQDVSEVITFQDVSGNAWYTEAIRWAEAEGIVEGYSEETFGTNDAVTREQLAAILWRYAKYKGMDISAGEVTDILDYTDEADISSYAVTAMQWAVSEGIVTGTGSLTLSPRATATRAQTACMIQRFDQ